jgi:hypothetical protein
LTTGAAAVEPSEGAATLAAHDDLDDVARSERKRVYHLAARPA